MSNKNKNQKPKNSFENKVEEQELEITEVQENTESKTELEKKAKPVKKAKAKKKKDKKQSVIGKKLKETASEVKKVSWPSFAKVVKHTGVVLAVVVIFAAVVFGIDRLLSWIFTLLTSSLA